MDNISNKNVSEMDIKRINGKALELVEGLINFKEMILKQVSSCDIITSNYPLLIEHILREAKLYRYYLILLENNQDISGLDVRQVETFWNEIMMEHAEFIRGLLDPSETKLIEMADQFSNEYNDLLEKSKRITDKNADIITTESLSETIKYKEFKTAGVEGLVGCDIKSIILPLLGDHVLREANHYIRLLREIYKQ